ncbi:DUF2786 domain-containing protein [Flavobacterium psychrophilum]|nr:DUF2786 domain-containing protein [Flavobacterium psychrophilum]EKT4510518.1 DUF2786 domain-containing protein [Flavobacterium psychrophilum]
METNDKIKVKIKALLSKTTDNGATHQEMESALKKANELMLQNFISEHDLKDFKVIEKCILKEVPLIKSGYDLTMFYTKLARLFDCEYYYNSKRIAFFGFEQDTEFCAYFYNVIVKTCLKEKEKYIKSSHFKEMRRMYHGKTLSASFIKGFQISVAEKMHQMYKERKRNVPESYGLMVIEKEENVKSQFLNLDLKIKSVKAKDVIVEQAVFDKGKEAGKTINLIQGIDSFNDNLFTLSE